MGMFAQGNPPNLPSPPPEYDPVYMSQMLNVLRLWFTQQNAVQQLNLAALNINLNTLPTQASLATLRAGDIYRDSTAGNVLKIKV
jgi:hypothetical protein